MKSKIIALALLGATAVSVTVYPWQKSVGANVPVTGTSPVNNTPVALPDPATNERPEIEVVFALDTTGSMAGLIQAAKEKIWSIATTMGSAQNAPRIKMGLVAYRDRGDTYVTRTIDLSTDLDSMYATLMDFNAGGGGDGPESVNQALHEAVTKMSWSKNPNTYKVVFLVGDAPAHMDYQNDVKYPQTLKIAQERGIVVNAIQCGKNRHATANWQQIAQLGQGDFFQVDQSGSAVAIATPYDKKLSALSRKMDKTRLYYGNAEQKAKRQRKVDATTKLHSKSSEQARARRATFNATSSGKANQFGEGELIEDVATGRVDLSTVSRDELPAAIQAMKPAEQQRLIQKTARERMRIRSEIQALAEKRATFLKEKVAEQGGAKDSLDDKLYRSVRDQASKRGLRYDAASPVY